MTVVTLWSERVNALFQRKFMVRTVYAQKRRHDNINMITHGKHWLKHFAGICVVGYDESDAEVIKGFFT